MARLAAAVYRDTDTPYFVAQCLDVDVASQGDSVAEALDNLREALELYFDDQAPPHSRFVTAQMIEFTPGGDQ